MEFLLLLPFLLMLLMLWPPKHQNWKTIARVTDNIDVEYSEGKKYKVTFSVFFEKTKDGDRRYRIIHSGEKSHEESINNYLIITMNLDEWISSGILPQNVERKI